MQMRISRNQLFYFLVRRINIRRIARQRCPAKWTNALAKQRANVSRNEPGKIKRVFYPNFKSHLAYVVAIVKYRDSLRVEIQHRSHVNGH